jgi:hypothetical protein
MIPNVLKMNSGERRIRNYFGSLFFPIYTNQTNCSLAKGGLM